MVPLMMLFNFANFTTTLGTYFLALVVPCCLLPFITSYKRKEVKVKDGLVLGITIFIFSWLGSFLAKYVNLNVKFILSGIIFICIGLWYLWYDITKIRKEPQSV